MNQSQILIAEMSDADGNKMGQFHIVAEVANSTNVILTCLPDADAVDEVLSGERWDCCQRAGRSDHEHDEKIGGIRLSGLLSNIAERASEQDDFRLLNTANDEPERL